MHTARRSKQHKQRVGFSHSREGGSLTDWRYMWLWENTVNVAQYEDFMLRRPASSVTIIHHSFFYLSAFAVSTVCLHPSCSTAVKRPPGSPGLSAGESRRVSKYSCLFVWDFVRWAGTFLHASWVKTHTHTHTNTEKGLHVTPRSLPT